ncbi:MAG: ABC transporter substrate-binding protein [Dehalococcoidia bacterium]|nr:ABC transporter substrate-binding protein [Dehalococcoidia bacterium]
MSDDRADQIWERLLTRRQLMSAVAAGGTSLALVGCGDDDDDASAPQATSGVPKKGGTVTIAGSQGGTVTDPHKSFIGTSDAWGLVAHTPLDIDWQKGTLEPSLVQKWEFPDPLTLLLSLKQGVHFQQESLARGREVEAADIVTSLDRIRTPGDPTFAGRRNFDRVATYEAVDKYTVRVKFKKPDANFLSLLSAGASASTILPREAIEKYGANLAVPEAWYGSGPFVLDPSSYKPGVSVSFNRNPTYDLEPGLPYLDKVTLLTVLEFSARSAGLRGGQIDVTNVSTFDAPDFRNRGFQMGSTENTLVTGQHLAMNVTLPPMNDPRVRQAIHRGIDREELLAVVADGFGCTVIILGCLPDWYLTQKEWEGKPGFRKDHKQDIAEAKQLLSAAGVDPTKTTLKLGVSQAATCLCKVHYDQGVALRGMIERDLGFKIDFVVDPASTNTAAWVRQNQAHLVNLSYGGQGPIILDAPLVNNFVSYGAANTSLWDDKKTDDLYDREVSELDTNKRKLLFHEIQRYLMQDDTLPGSPTVRNFDWYAANPKMRGWKTPAYYLGNYAFQYDKVWLNS